MNKQVKAGLWLFLGIIGVPSIYELFQIIFLAQIKEGNVAAWIGWIPAFIGGLLAILNSIAILFGYKHLGEMLGIKKE